MRKPLLHQVIGRKYVRKWLNDHFVLGSDTLYITDYQGVLVHVEEELLSCVSSFATHVLRLRSSYYLVCVRDVDAVKTLGGAPYGHR